MRTRLLVVAALLAASAVWAWRAGARPPAPGPEAPRGAAPAAAAGPTLTGRAPEAEGGAPATSEPPPAPAAPPAAGETPGTAPQPLGWLLTRLRAEVVPAAWDDQANALASVGPGYLLVRAPPVLQDEVGAFLDELRRQALASILVESGEGAEAGMPGAGDPLPADPVERPEGREQLRALFRRMRTQWLRLRDALEARARGEVATTRRLLGDVLAEEPDHEAARAYLAALDAPAPPAATTVPDPDAGGLEVDRTPLGRAEALAGQLGPGRLAGWAERWPSAATRGALARARHRAALPGYALVGEDRDRRLAEPAPPLPAVVRDLDDLLEHLSVECLLDLEVAGGIEWPRGGPVPRLEPQGATLADLFAAVAASLSPQHRFEVYPRRLHLTDGRQPPRAVVEIFDVSDLQSPPPTPR